MKCLELNRRFETKESMFRALKSNLKSIVSLKTASVKNSDAESFFFTKSSNLSKSFNTEDGFIYPVINTCNWMDSHGDVHIDGLWQKSITEQQGKVFYLVNHDLKIGSVIAYPQDVFLMTEKITWSQLGQSYDGTTEALIFKTKLFDYSNSDAKVAIENKLPVENSVRMQYVKIQLAIDSMDEDYKEEKATWEKYISKIVNKEKAIERGYFWAVTEGKIYKEGSMVLLGSNEVTPILYPENKEIEPIITQENEPFYDTRKLVKMIENIKNL